MQWFSFLIIFEHNANIINPNRRIIPSLLKVFAMFEFCLIGDKDKLDAVAIRCINCKKETGLYFKNSTFEKCSINLF